MEEIIILEEGEFRGFSKDVQSYFRSKLIQCEEELKDIVRKSRAKMSENPVIPEPQSPHTGGDQPDKDLLSDLEKADDDDNNDNDSACRAEIDAVLDSIQPEDLFGEKITDRIADTFDRLMKKEFTEVEVKEMKSGLKIPENARALAVPKIPKNLWKQVPGKFGEADLKCQFIHHSLTRALVATAKLTEGVYQADDKVPKQFRLDVAKGLMDVAKNLSMPCRDLNVHRRQNFKPALRNDVVSVCSGPWEPTEFLFPEDLEKEIKLSKAASSIVKTYEKPLGRNPPYFNRRRFTNGPQNFGNDGYGSRALNSRGPFRHRGGGRQNFRLFPPANQFQGQSQSQNPKTH